MALLGLLPSLFKLIFFKFIDDRCLWLSSECLIGLRVKVVGLF